MNAVCSSGFSPFVGRFTTHRGGQLYFRLSPFYILFNPYFIYKLYRTFLFPVDCPPRGRQPPLGKATVPHTNGQGEKGKTMLKVLASKQRQISSDIPVDEQIDNLNSLIKNPPQNSRIVEITPEVAHYILENLNIGNRSLKKARIVQYAADMVGNNWSLTNATLAFGADGYLKDGQNRLTACVRANKPFMTHAIFGIKPDSFIHMDIGAKRSHTDVFTIMGVPYPSHTGSVIRYIMAFDKQLSSARSIKTTNDDLRSFYNSLDHQVLELVVRMYYLLFL